MARLAERASPATHVRLRRLAANARDGQWSAAEAIDWRPAPKLPFWMTREQVRAAVSQLYHGEVATSRMCRALHDAIEPGPARDCLALQFEDETRHAAVYARYLARLGGIAPLDPTLDRALEAARSGPFGPLGAILAFNLVLESEVLRVHGALARLLPCPLLTGINRLVARDEARHVAFGRLYLATAVAQLPAEARCELRRWIHAIWRDSAEAALARPSRGGAARRALRRWLLGGWRHHEAALRQIGLCPEAEGAAAR